VHLEDGHHVAELTAEAAKERQHHLAIADGVAELSEGCSHGLEATAVVGDAQRLLTKIAELRLEEKSTRLLLAEEFILEVAPCIAC
jgi:predicted N-formylglutamate amidohydrolase